MANAFVKEKNEELVELSVKSTDFEHRIAAAWYYGLAQEPSDCLLVLLVDQHPLVVQAARESCVSIAKRKYRDAHIDFGPRLNATSSSKDDCLNLWQSYFESKTKGSKKTEKPEAPAKREKTAQEILGVD